MNRFYSVSSVAINKLFMCNYAQGGKRMATTVKMCDMSKQIAIRVFQMLNGHNVQLKEHGPFGTVIVTDIEPENLVYPEGWYYAKGSFRNKHTSTTGIYEEVTMLRSNGSLWGDSANYCTLE